MALASPPIHGYELAIDSVASGRGYTLCVPSVDRVDDDLVFRPIADAVAPIQAVLLSRLIDDDTPRVSSTPLTSGDVSDASSLVRRRYQDRLTDHDQTR